jgi:hypothetical protein
VNVSPALSSRQEMTAVSNPKSSPPSDPNRELRSRYPLSGSVVALPAAEKLFLKRGRLIDGPIRNGSMTARHQSAYAIREFRYRFSWPLGD